MISRKSLFICLLGVLSVQAAYSQRKKKKGPEVPPPPALVTTLDSVSYTIGNDMGEMLKKQGLDTLNLRLFFKAIEDIYKGDSAMITTEKGMSVVKNYLQQIKLEKATRNKAAGEQFLAANKTKEGVNTTPSGLQYQVLVNGTGPKPSLQDKVKVHYTGKLIDGTIFDSSEQRGEPIVLPITGVIKGWTEALQLMPVGSKWKLFIPADLAYGERQAGAKIQPNSTLVFDVQLLEIVKE
ncbi:FKBP-type peptidyl-prolyl cis-trans isomerase [Chitinophaga rhizosphaerae]|uniref:FKBP-type peptidyl-prolyl cis-trans isomerase n=1 Tax=Chitinophaga rhizosphaerae TaxID=1864947 RepID=UPI000F811D7B|nr:FKBP-type peptidyl-prolyl cis-trans isomerase [Chitinophaga rhizosphaerae]